MREKEYMTSAGLERLQAQMRDLKEQLRALRLYKGEEAIYAGDNWHDNPVLYQAEAKERALMRAIAELNARIRNAELIEAPEEFSVVRLGSRVDVRFEDGSVETYRILGEADSDPGGGVVSYRSPLGCALMNRAVGDRVTYRVGESSHEVEVLSIRRA